MTKISELFSKKGSLLSTEFLPPRAPRLSELVKKTLEVASVVDSVSLPELKANERNGLRKHRMNPFYAALRLRDLTGVETVFHITPRDYNKNAIAGILLAAAEANLQNILVVSGDRYSAAEEATLSKNVYDFHGTLDIIAAIKSLEKDAGIVPTGGFCVVVGVDPSVVYTKDEAKIEAEISKLIERQESGAELVQTQPVFDMRFLEFFDAAREHGLRIPVLVGILPLRGRDDSTEIERRYGIRIPNDVKSALHDIDEEAGKQAALELASSLVRNGVRGLHVYPREDCDFVLRVARAAFGS